MTTPVVPLEEQLRALEEATSRQVEQAVAEAVAATPAARIAGALAAAVPVVAQIIRRAVAAAWQLGMAVAQAAAAAAGAARWSLGRAVRRVRGRRSVQSRTRPLVRPAPPMQVPGTPDVAEQVRQALAEFAERIEQERHLQPQPTGGESRRELRALQQPSPEPAAQERVVEQVERAKAAVGRLAADTVNEAAAAGTIAAARRLGARAVMWIAERDACLHCLALSGVQVQVGRRFRATLTFGDRPLEWRGFNGRPPRHPNCRCRIVPVFGDGRAQGEALRREARRSVLRGWSLPSESELARLRAAARLLRRGSGLPRSVEEYARQAVAEGRFPRGRSFPEHGPTPGSGGAGGSIPARSRQDHGT